MGIEMFRSLMAWRSLEVHPLLENTQRPRGCFFSIFNNTRVQDLRESMCFRDDHTKTVVTVLPDHRPDLISIKIEWFERKDMVNFAWGALGENRIFDHTLNIENCPACPISFSNDLQTVFFNSLPILEFRKNEE